jgi:hypothetical protein
MLAADKPEIPEPITTTESPLEHGMDAISNEQIIENYICRSITKKLSLFKKFTFLVFPLT